MWLLSKYRISTVDQKIRLKTLKQYKQLSRSSKSLRLGGRRFLTKCVGIALQYVIGIQRQKVQVLKVIVLRMIRHKCLAVCPLSNIERKIRKIQFRRIMDIFCICRGGQASESYSAGESAALAVYENGGHARTFAKHFAVTPSNRCKLNLKAK